MKHFKTDKFQLADGIYWLLVTFHIFWFSDKFQEGKIVEKYFEANWFLCAELLHLAEEVNLTHKGSALTSIEKYDRPVSDDEEEDGEIHSDIVTAAHFGGGKVEKDVFDQGSKRFVLSWYFLP